MGNFATLGVWVHAWLLFAHASATLAFYFPLSLVPARRDRTCRIESASESVRGVSSTEDLGSPWRKPRKLSSKKTYPRSARRRTGMPKGESRSHQLRMAETSIDGAVNLQEADTNVLVPVSDIVDASLSDLSRAAADTLVGSLMGDDENLDSVEVGDRGSSKMARHIAMDRFCKTLESVYRTEFMTRIGEVKAAHVLDGRRSLLKKKTRRTPDQIDGRTRTLDKNTPKKSLKRSPSAVSRSSLSGVVKHEALEANPFSIRREWWKPRRPKKEDAESTTEVNEDRKSGPRVGRDSSRAARRRQGASTSKDQAHRLQEEEESLPLLQLVEDLLRDAMFNPISERDVMMSQALAAEFPTTARVRPEFGSLANVFDLLHERPQWTFWDPERDAGSNANSTVAAGRYAMVPFDGRLLMFKRGNAVEETKGRLLLKKLDYIQSNAVRWLSQSLTDTIKRQQDRAAEFIRSLARETSRRKQSALEAFVERAVEFGLERDSLVTFLKVGNSTDPSTAKANGVGSGTYGRRCVKAQRAFEPQARLEDRVDCANSAFPSLRPASSHGQMF